MYRIVMFCFFQAEDGIRDLVRSRGLGDVYKRQPLLSRLIQQDRKSAVTLIGGPSKTADIEKVLVTGRPLYTSDAAAERSSGDLGGRRVIKKKKQSIQY